MNQNAMMPPRRIAPGAAKVEIQACLMDAAPLLKQAYDLISGAYNAARAIDIEMPATKEAA